MGTRKDIKFLIWTVVIFSAAFFMPVNSETLLTAIHSILDLARWYAREHIVLCLLPAFFIAGVIAVFVSQGAVLKYFGANAKKWVSYTVASVSGGILAVCSCTILPLFTSIYKRGAGLGPAIAFLYSGPRHQHTFNNSHSPYPRTGDGTCPSNRCRFVCCGYRSCDVVRFP